ncbi:hypothetical protein [Streptomyces tsukubensis]|uniref:hypothetical protein n=1 Tax=Streptomyces tsukubensis TaxID=83656 RepID=UPI003450D694
MSRWNRRNMAVTEELLQGSGVFQDVFADFDSDAFLERIVARAARGTRTPRPAATPPDHCTPAGEIPPVPPAAPAAPAAREEVPAYREAAQRLEALSAKVVSTPDAVAAMSRLVDSPRTDPAGALTFACLLYLSGSAEGAEFWWRFASGAGVATAAYCLYLHHTQSSEEEMARFWFDQAHRLHHQAGESLYPRIDTAPPTPVTSTHYTPQSLVTATVAAPLSGDDEVTDPALGSGQFLRWAIDHLTTADAVLRLDVHTDDDYGSVPRPDPALATELRKHLEHSH